MSRSRYWRGNLAHSCTQNWFHSAKWEGFLAFNVRTQNHLLCRCIFIQMWTCWCVLGHCLASWHDARQWPNSFLWSAVWICRTWLLFGGLSKSLKEGWVSSWNKTVPACGTDIPVRRNQVWCSFGNEHCCFCTRNLWYHGKKKLTITGFCQIKMGFIPKNQTPLPHISNLRLHETIVACST